MKKYFCTILILLSVFLSACNTVNQTTEVDKYMDETPKLGMFEKYKVIPADNPLIAGYQPWIFDGFEITHWLTKQTKMAGSRPEFSPWLDSNYFVLDYDNLKKGFYEYEKYIFNKRYLGPGRDCEDYAFSFKSWLQFELADDYGELAAKAAAAVSVIFVEQRYEFGGVPGGAGTYHALVGIGSNEGPIIYEPQSRVWAKLKDYPNKAYIYYIIR